MRAAPCVAGSTPPSSLLPVSFMSRPTGKCIFCGASGNLTKQHIIPNRLRRLVPRVETDHTQHKMRVDVGGQIGTGGGAAILGPGTIQQHQGHVGNRRWRRVCRTCNEGWIRVAEEAAFPIITPFILGEKEGKMTRKDQDQVALMIAIMTVMADVDDPPTSGITQEERSFLFQERRPHPYWRLFIGRVSSEEWITRMRHQGGKITLYKGSDICALPEYMQVTTLGMGRFFFHALSGPDFWRPSLINYAAKFGIAPIFPAFTEINWASLPVLDTDRMMALSNAMIGGLPTF